MLEEEVEEVAGFFTGNCCVTGKLFLVLVLVAVVVVVVCSIGGGGGVFFILGGLGGATLTGVFSPVPAGLDCWGIIEPVSSLVIPPAGLAFCCCCG